MDIRFSAFDFVAVTRNYWPQQLQDYCSKLQSLFVNNFFCENATLNMALAFRLPTNKHHSRMHH